MAIRIKWLLLATTSVVVLGVIAALTVTADDGQVITRPVPTTRLYVRTVPPGAKIVLDGHRRCLDHVSVCVDEGYIERDVAASHGETQHSRVCEDEKHSLIASKISSSGKPLVLLPARQRQFDGPGLVVDCNFRLRGRWRWWWGLFPAAWSAEDY